jgi:hypothetical protein
VRLSPEQEEPRTMEARNPSGGEDRRALVAAVPIGHERTDSVGGWRL